MSNPPEPARLDRFQLAERISDWVDRLDLGDDDARTTFATGLASALAAAEEARFRLEALLRTAPIRDTGEAERALDELTELQLQLTSELGEHLEEIGEAWTSVEDRLIELGPDE